MILYIAIVFGFFLLARRSLSLAAALILFLLPVYQWRLTVLGVPSTVLELLVLTLFVAWVLRRIRRGGRPLSRIPWRWAAPLFLLSAVVAIFVSPDRISALGYCKAYILEPILFFLVLWDTIQEERQVRTLLFAIGAASLFLSLVAFAQYLGFLPSPEPWISETPKRVASLLEYPNALGLFLVPVIALFSAFFLIPVKEKGAQKRFLRWFPIGVVFFGVLSLLFVVSRGGLVAIAAAAVFYAVLSPYRKWIFFALGMGLLLLLGMTQTRTILVNIIRGTDVSTDVRYVLWQGTARLLVDRPIVGAGLGGFPILYEEYRLIKHTEFLLYPHNIILNAWVELGLAGALLFCWLIIDACRRAFRLVQSALTPFGHQLVYGTLAALLAVVVHGIVDVPYFKNDLAIQFWFLLSLIPIAGRLHLTGQKR